MVSCSSVFEDDFNMLDLKCFYMICMISSLSDLLVFVQCAYGTNSLLASVIWSFDFNTYSLHFSRRFVQYAWEP